MFTSGNTIEAKWYLPMLMIMECYGMTSLLQYFDAEIEVIKKVLQFVNQC